MRKVFLAAVLLATMACGAYRTGPGPAVGSGSLSGRVTAVPCAPVETPDSTCIPQPVSGLKLDFTAADGSLASATTDKNGGYSMRLAAGTWKVNMNGFRHVVSGPSTVNVSVGSSVIADFVIDSGIR
jgi:hypothetical protein